MSVDLPESEIRRTAPSERLSDGTAEASDNRARRRAYDLSRSKIEFLVAGGSDDQFQVIRYHGTEGLSLLFRFEIELSAAAESAELGDLVGRPATFRFEAPAGERRFHGIVGRFQYIGEHRGESFYRVEFVPHLWLLTHRYHCRIFQHKSLTEIVTDVLTGAGVLDATFHLDVCLIDKHPAREYCVQYRETDFNFICRLMEEEGVFYFFEHADATCRMVLADSPFFQPLDPEDRSLPFMPPSGMNVAEEHVFHFQQSQEVRPTGVVLRDYNHEKPSLDLNCQGGDRQGAGLEVSDYPGRYDSQAVGHALAEVRAEELRCRSQTALGRSNCRRLASGTMFRLRGHPRAECDGEYVVTRVVHQGRQAIAHTFDESTGPSGVLNSALAQALDQASRHDDSAVRDLARSVQALAGRLRRPASRDARTMGLWLLHGGQLATDPAALAAARGGDPLDWVRTLAGFSGQCGEALLDVEAPIYECEFECIPVGMTFRPPRLSPRPLMRGSQTAVVVGPAGEEIYTDAQGRVKVQFYWDREGQRNENSSCWIRVSQPWAGRGFGGIAIPRIGQEVIVDFLEGDPDRPIITGRVYNGEQMQPQDLPASQAASPSGKKPIPEMQGRVAGLPAAKTRTTMKSNSTPGGGGANELAFDDAAGSELFFINATKDAVRTVGNNDRTSVGTDQSLSVGSNQDEFVGANRDRHVGANEMIHIGANQTENVVANRTTTIGVNDTETIGANKAVQIGANHTETVAIAKAETIGAAKAETIGLAKALTIGAAYQVSVGAAMNESVGGAKTEEVGAYKLEAVGGDKKSVIGGDMDHNVSGKHVMKAMEITLDAATKITVQCGASKIVLTPATLTISAPLVKINC